MTARHRCGINIYAALAEPTTEHALAPYAGAQFLGAQERASKRANGTQWPTLNTRPTSSVPSNLPARMAIIATPRALGVHMVWLEAWRESNSAPEASAPEFVYDELIPGPLDEGGRDKLRATVRGGVSDADFDAALAVFDGDPFAIEPQERVLALAVRNHALFQRLNEAIAGGEGAWAEYLLRSSADYGGATEVLPALGVQAVSQLRKIVSAEMRQAIDGVLARTMD